MNTIRNFTILICLFLVGCAEKSKYEYGPTLRCGNCKRVIYDGPFERDRNGMLWPVYDWHNCPAWDINCVSKYDSKRDEEHKTHWGYEDGRKDALEFHYHKEFDPKVHHPFYVEGYKRGYKEVIDVRGLPNVKKVVE